MKTHLLRIILTAILITPVYSQETDGFVNMFNGKDLTSWKSIGNWTIEENNILATYGKENVDHHECGDIIRTQAASKNIVKPAGAWNRYTITLKGNSLKVVMKGRPAKGHNNFQDETKCAWYRNVRIKEI
jgi:hypothetical protein